MRMHSGRAPRLCALLFLPTVGAATLGLGACAPSFENARTPSGQYCSDMPIYLNNQPDPDKPFHRIKPIATPLIQLTAPERLEALRKEACKLGGDAVINAGDEDAQTTDHIVIVRASGYAVRWTGPIIRSISSHGSSGSNSIGASSGIGSSTPAPPPPAAPAPAAEPDQGGSDGEGGGPSKAPAIAPKKKTLK